MKSLYLKTLSKHWIILGIVLLLLIIMVQVVSATTTPQVCDDFVKYYCTKVTYVSDPGGWKITDRFYRGGIDGSFDIWQTYWTKDMEKINGIWTVQETWGTGSWYGNVPLSSWYTRGADRVRINYSMVQFRIRFQLCDGGNCWYSCSGYLQHQMWNNLSAEFGTGICD